jgi:hypothetical protein
MQDKPLMNEQKSEGFQSSPLGPDGHRRIIIAGGGTGGHIFPAIAIANAIKNRRLM